MRGPELVYGELLMGDRGGRRKLLADYEHRQPIPHQDVVAFVRDRRLHGRGIGSIDAHLLATALVSRVKYWTTDPRLGLVAEESGIGFG